MREPAPTLVYDLLVNLIVESMNRNRKEPQAKRGSWMSGRPFAESEDDMNPDALIYVQRPTREHNRTYTHKRYIHMQGKTQHVKAGLQIRVMSIAHYRQLPHIQRITRVFTSKFEAEEGEGK